MDTPSASELLRTKDYDDEVKRLFFDKSPESEIEWIETFLTIESEQGQVVDFKLYPQQRQMAFNRTGRDITVKGRQTRASSYILARNLRRMTTEEGLKCLVGGTLIRGANGKLSPIEETKPGDIVWTHTGVEAQVSCVWPTGEKQTVDVVLPGKETVRCTPDHLWYTERGWQEASSLGNFRIAITPRPPCDKKRGPRSWWLGRQKRGGYVSRKRAKNGERREVHLTREFGRVVGLYLAEGSLTRGGLCFGFHEDETNLAGFVRQVMEPFGTVTIKKTPGKKALRVDVHSAPLRDLFESKLYSQGKKIVPDNFWRVQSPQFARGVIGGYIEGDGHIHKSRPTITVGSVQKSTLRQLRDLAFSVHHIWGTIYSRSKLHGYSKNIQHMLVWDSSAGEYLRDFYGWPKKIASQKPRMWEIVEGGVCLLRVLSVNEAPTEKVWDLEVSHPDHSFQVETAFLKNCLVLTQDDQTTATFRARIKHHLRDLSLKGWHYNLGLDNDDELVIEDTECRYLFGSGQEKTAGRAYTASLVHCSELAHFPKEQAGLLIGGITPSVPGPPYGQFDIESTPNGAEGTFYDMVAASKVYDPSARWSTHFYPWWLEPRYRAGTTLDCDLIYGESQWKNLLEDFEPNQEEQKLSSEFGLDKGQLIWRRIRKKEQDRTGAPFSQEYPESLEGCFVSAGGSYFASPDGLNHLDRYRHTISPPQEVLPALTYKENDVSFHGPNLQVWQRPQPGQAYVVWVDCAGGGLDEDSDFSAVMVLNANHCFEAARLNIKCSPQELAPMVVAIAQWYNGALLGGERDAYGSVCLSKIQELYYKNLWYYVDLSKPLNIHKGPSEPWGHPTQIRNIILDSLRERVFAGTFSTSDGMLVQQMSTFTWRKSVGKREQMKAQAKKGFKDDLVMCAAGATYISNLGVARFNAVHGASSTTGQIQEGETIVLGPGGLVVSRSTVPKPPRWLR